MMRRLVIAALVVGVLAPASGALATVSLPGGFVRESAVKDGVGLVTPPEHLGKCLSAVPVGVRFSALSKRKHVFEVIAWRTRLDGTHAVGRHVSRATSDGRWHDSVIDGRVCGSFAIRYELRYAPSSSGRFFRVVYKVGAKG